MECAFGLCIAEGKAIGSYKVGDTNRDGVRSSDLKVTQRRKLLGGLRILAVKAAAAYAMALMLSQLVPVDVFLREDVEKRMPFKNSGGDLLTELGLEGSEEWKAETMWRRKVIHPL